MSFRSHRTLALLASSLFCLARVAAQDQYTFCTDDGCGDCPVSVTTVGTGYPECAIYSSDEVFGGQGFPTKNELITAHFDVPQQDTSAPCYLIFKSPASTESPGCGEITKTFQTATCGEIKLEETFMMQFCCGRDDCAAAGIPNNPKGRSIGPSAKFGRGTLEEQPFASGARSLRFAVNGTEVKPIYVGTPVTAESKTKTKKSILPRDGVCAGDWVPLSGKEDYTRPADNAQIVSSVYNGPITVEITESRTQEWSTTIEASLGFGDILSLGISFSSTMSESETNSETGSYRISNGLSGYVVWTSFVRCSEGSGTCNGAQVTGEVCVPYLDANSNKLAGEYSLVEQG